MPRTRAGLAVALLPMALLAQERTRTIPLGPGYARTSVNTVIFRQHALTTWGDRQFAGYYDEEGRVVLARRKLDGERFELHRTELTGNVRDAHNAICIAIDGRGVLHLAWDHHGHALHYACGVEPGKLEVKQIERMTGVRERRVTYPEFYNLPGGDLLFLYRDGGSGNGDTLLKRWDVKQQEWRDLCTPLIAGEGQRNAYTNQIVVDPQGRWHLSWSWRESPDVATNHDLCYARSEDAGKHWVRSDGRDYELPITAGSAEVIVPIAQGSELINQVSSAVDSEGRPMLATYWRAEGDSAPQYRLVWWDGGKWRISRIGERKLDFSLSGGGTKRIRISRPQVLVDGNDKVFVLFRDQERGAVVSMAQCADPERVQWEIADITGDSVGRWEPNVDRVLWRRDGLLHMLLQRVGQGDGERLEQVPPQLVSVLEWRG